MSSGSKLDAMNRRRTAAKGNAKKAAAVAPEPKKNNSRLERAREKMSWPNVIGDEALKSWYLDVSRTEAGSFMEFTIHIRMGHYDEETGQITKTGSDPTLPKAFLWEPLKMTWVALAGRGNPKNTTSDSFGGTFRVGASAEALEVDPATEDLQLAFLRQLDKATDRVRELMMQSPALIGKYDSQDEDGYLKRRNIIQKLYREYSKRTQEAKGKQTPVSEEDFSAYVTTNDCFVPEKERLAPKTLEKQLKKRNELIEYRQRYLDNYRQFVFAQIMSNIPNKYVDKHNHPNQTDIPKITNTKNQGKNKIDVFVENEQKQRQEWETAPFITRYRNAWIKWNKWSVVKTLVEDDPKGYKGKRLSNEYANYMKQFCKKLTRSNKELLIDQALYLNLQKNTLEPQFYGRPIVSWQGHELSYEALPDTLDDQAIQPNSRVSDVAGFYISAPSGKAPKIRLDLGWKLDVFEVGQPERERPSYDGALKGVGSMADMIVNRRARTEDENTSENDDRPVAKRARHPPASEEEEEEKNEEQEPQRYLQEAEALEQQHNATQNAQDHMDESDEESEE